MRKFLGAALTALLLFANCAPVGASDRAVAYPAQVPTNNQANQNPRFARIALGEWIIAALGPNAAASGVYSNLSIAPATGLYVTVQPRANQTCGNVYQTVADDPNPVPASPSPQLSPDPTLIGVGGRECSATAPIGPLTAPSAGLSVYYLIEAQVTPAQPSATQSMLFQNQSGQPYALSVATLLTDVLTFTYKAGTPSSTPSVPAVDSGYVPIGTVLVANGISQVTTGMIAQTNPCGTGNIANCAPFPGFLQNGSVVHVSVSPSPSPDPGNAAVSGTFSASQLFSTATTGTPPLQVQSTTLVPNLHAATADSSTNVTGIVGIANGGTGTNAPSGTTCGTSGNLTCSGTFPNTTIDLSSALSGLTSVSATNGSFSNGSITALTLPTLPSQACLGTTSAGVVQAGTCPGSIAYNATSPITASTSSGSVTYACPTCVSNAASNTYVSPSVNQTIGAAGTATNLVGYGSLGSWQLQNSLWNGSAAVNHLWGMNADNAGNLKFLYDGAPQWTLSNTGTVNTSHLALSGVLSANCVGTDGSGNIISNATCTGSGGTPVTSVTGGTNVTSTGGSTPVVDLASPAPTACPSAMLGMSATNVLQSENGCAVTSVTASTNIVVGGTAQAPTVAVTAAPSFSGTITLSGSSPTIAASNALATTLFTSKNSGTSFNFDSINGSGSANTIAQFSTGASPGTAVARIAADGSYYASSASYLNVGSASVTAGSYQGNVGGTTTYLAPVIQAGGTALASVPHMVGPIAITWTTNASCATAATCMTSAPATTTFTGGAAFTSLSSYTCWASFQVNGLLGLLVVPINQSATSVTWFPFNTGSAISSGTTLNATGWCSGT